MKLINTFLLVLVADLYNLRKSGSVPVDVKKIRSVQNSTDWDFFMLVQRWPLSTCQIVNASGHPCGIPKEVKGWTIHGLWPTGVTSYPQFCHNWTFNMSQVQDLENIMLHEWPNLYLKETVDSLWKHEYEKHGTCAASIHGFEKEHDYFEQTLNLAHKYDIQKILEQNDIFPRTGGYEISYLVGAINRTYSKVVCPGCGYVQGVGQVLSQSYVCFDKQLQQIDCPQCEKPCNYSMPVLYQPLHYDHDFTF